MIPSGGFSIIFHALVNLLRRDGYYTKPVRSRRDSVWATVVLLAITLLIFSAAARLLWFALSGETNAEIIADYMYPCSNEPRSITSRMALIRLDDVQAHAWSTISARMMADAEARGIPLVLGVIPYNIEEDRQLYQLLHEKRCLHEIAQHGWDHDYVQDTEAPEFAERSYEDAYLELRHGKRVLERLSREPLTTFIPPDNQLSQGARDALLELKIPIISSEGIGRFDYGAATFDYDTDTLVPVDRIIEDCAVTVVRTRLCVVMLHPQDFTTNGSIDETKYVLYLDTLDRLQAHDYTFVRFKDLVSPGQFTSWKDYSVFKAIQ